MIISDIETGAYLDSHVVVARPVEVSVRPFGEGVLAKLICGAMVIEGELRVRLEELGLLHLYCIRTLINNLGIPFIRN